MLKLVGKGDFRKTKDFLRRIQRGDIYSDLHRYGEMGVKALERSTPKDTSLTSLRWQYRITGTKQFPSIEWYNTNKDKQGSPIVILIQYGHGTRSGTHIQGRDFINPAMRPVFDKIASEIWKKVQA